MQTRINISVLARTYPRKKLKCFLEMFFRLEGVFALLGKIGIKTKMVFSFFPLPLVYPMRKLLPYYGFWCSSTLGSAR
jgi:hypothetical protein